MFPANNPQRTEEEEGGIDFGQFLSAIKRRSLLVIVIAAAVTSATAYWSKTRPPIYQGQFQILIEPVTAESEVVSAIAGNNPGVQAQELGETQASKAVIDYPTQIEVLLSRKLLMPVVENLKPQLPGIGYGKLKSRIEIKRIASGKQQTKILQINYQGSDSEEVQLVLDALSKHYISYSLNERQTNLRRAMQFVDAQLPKVQLQVRQIEGAVQKFRERYSLVDPSTQSSQISAQLSGIQQKELDNQAQLMETRRLYSALQGQLQLQPKTAEAGAVLSDAPGYQQIADQLRQTEADLAAASADLTPDHPTVIALQEKRDKLDPLLRQRAQQALGTDLFSEVKGSQFLPYQDSLRKSLSTQLVDASIQIQVLETQRQAIAEAKAILAQQMRQLPALTRQYETLQRQLQIASANLSKFLEKREELQINAARQEVPWELVSLPTQSQGAITLSRDLMLGSLLGILLGIGTAILLDNLGDVIHRTEDLRAEVKQPLLGVIPLQEDLTSPALPDMNDSLLGMAPQEQQGLEEQLIPSKYSFSPLLEAFRSLASQLRLLDPDTPVRSLTISSSLPGEGKTTVAVHLAQAAAALGQKVLLVDADLRAPSLSSVLGLPIAPGLSDIIATDLSVREVVHKLPHENNLSVITAGIPPVDPTRCLASKRMKDLVENFSADYDLVIYDAPPLGLADVTLLGTQTEGLIVVARLGMVHRASLRDQLRNLNTSKVPVWGIVANGVPGYQIRSSIPEYYGSQMTA